MYQLNHSWSFLYEDTSAPNVPIYHCHEGAPHLLPNIVDWTISPTPPTFMKSQQTVLPLAAGSTHYTVHTQRRRSVLLHAVMRDFTIANSFPLHLCVLVVFYIYL